MMGFLSTAAALIWEQRANLSDVSRVGTVELAVIAYVTAGGLAPLVLGPGKAPSSSSGKKAN